MIPSSKIGSGRRRGRVVWRAWAGPVLACLLAVAAAILPARADEASANAGLVDPAVEAGQPAEYHIDVTNGRLREAPPAPTVDGLSITYSGERQSAQYSFDGGSLHSTVTSTYVYSIETSQPGRFVIPGQDIQLSRGGTLSVSPVTLNVMSTGGNGGTAGGGRPARQSYFVELVIPKKTAYVGESIPAELRAYFGREVRHQDDPSPILNGEGFSVQKFAAPQPSAATVEGEQFRLATYKTALAGVKTGTITVGPASISPIVQLPRPQPRRRSPFNDPFADSFFNDPDGPFGMAPAKQVTIQSEPVTVEIKPLPPGKPADFSGAIGQFKLDVEADPRKAATGDPVTMHLSLRGQGNFDRISPPVLVDETGLRTYPPASKFKADDEVGLSGLKSFDQVVIANSARTSLPGYRFNYFDPSTGRYEAVETPPLAVSITGAALASPTPAASTAGASTPAPSATPAATPRPPEDILYIRNDFGQPRDAAGFLPVYRRARFWEFLGWAVLLISLAGALAFWKRRTRDEAIRRAADLQRQRASLDRTLREENLARGAFYSAARRLAQLRAAATSSRPGADLTPGEIREAKRLPPDVAGSVEEIFHRHDELAYSGRATALEPVPAEERRAVLATLETLGKN